MLGTAVDAHAPWALRPILHVLPGDPAVKSNIIVSHRFEDDSLSVSDRP